MPKKSKKYWSIKKFELYQLILDLFYKLIRVLNEINFDHKMMFNFKNGCNLISYITESHLKV